MKEVSVSAGSTPILPKNTTVGIIGVGDMGLGIASSIVRTFPMVAYDVRSEPVHRLVTMGARRAASVEEIADTSNVAVIVVAKDEQVTDVVEKLLRHPGKLHTIIVSSTVLPRTMTDLDGAARKAGIHLIDAPVTGGSEKAERGWLTLVIGGDEEIVKRCTPILQTYGRYFFYMGPLGAGNAGKLVNNLLSMAGYALALEAMQLADAYGISEDKITELTAVGGGDSKTLRQWGRLDRVRKNHPQTGTPNVYQHFSRDATLAVLAARDRGVNLPITTKIGEVMAGQLEARDKLIDARGGIKPLPRCTICGQELAVPFRKAGIHPECAQYTDKQ